MIAIVGRMHPHVVPHRFDGVELWTVRRQQAKMEAMPIASEPLLHFWSLVVRRIVMNEEDFLPAVALRHRREKRCIGHALEHLPVRVVKPRPIEIHRAKYLLGIALAGGWNQRLVSAPRPGLVQSRVLAEAGLVAEDQRGFAFSRFFLAWDKCIAAIGPVRPDRLSPTCGAVVGRKSPSP